jgi:glycerophosphoryl diester phosphodiesterase
MMTIRRLPRWTILIFAVLGCALLYVQSVRSQQQTAGTAPPELHLMRRAQLHSSLHGGRLAPVFSPSDDLLSQHRLNARAVHDAGFPVVVWTVNDPQRMAELFELPVDGIISDRPDLLHDALVGKKSGTRLLGDDGEVDRTRFDAEGHRGGRDLRPENTLPAFEAGLDNLISTIETDTGVTRDGVSVISHEPFVNPQTCRQQNGKSYTEENQKLIKDLSASEIQSVFICDKVFRGPTQQNDLTLSPVSVAFAEKLKLAHPYVLPTTQQLFDFVRFYQEYYCCGAGKDHPAARVRSENARRVRFNLETKIDPRPQFANRTFAPEAFVKALTGVITSNKMEARSDVQSFDFRTLVLVEEQFPSIRTVYLVGDPGQLQEQFLPQVLR